ncbi:MAG: bifunctional methionine sulfoxide reductase B/A protein [Fibrobacteres bacterium]|nr:bifunctional methionine sulfoxide reductase B/A protein [Fibrobacterota bacterium]
MRTGIFLLALVALTGLFGADRVASQWSARFTHPSGEVQVRDLTNDGELTPPVLDSTDDRNDSDWLATLSPQRHAILRQAHTEKPFTGELLKETREGWYKCHACGLPLFKSDGKFNSGCGWPSFHTPAAFENIKTRSDNSLGMHRTEILCARCGSHLGHLFDDGPAPTGLRYCVNSLSMDFAPGLAKVPSKTDTAVFAAGCFWGVEKLFAETPGVVSTAVGYTGGNTQSPTYKQVCTGTTGHAEAVEVVFDPGRIGYEKLVELFFLSHDPTTPNRQGPDHGTQYRSAIFHRDADQEAIARKVRDRLVADKNWSSPVVTEFAAAGRFWKAEDYHQKWFLTHPVQCHRPGVRR